MLDSLEASPPIYIAPKPLRPELIVDHQGVMLADPGGYFVGVDTNWGRGGPLSRLLYAQRSGTRDL